MKPDSFEIRRWSGERVYVTFVRDCCDREVTGFVAAPEPLCGEHVRDMMVQAVDHLIDGLAMPVRGPRLPLPARDRACMSKAKADFTSPYATLVLQGFRRAVTPDVESAHALDPTVPNTVGAPR